MSGSTSKAVLAHQQVMRKGKRLEAGSTSTVPAGELWEEWRN